MRRARGDSSLSLSIASPALSGGGDHRRQEFNSRGDSYIYYTASDEEEGDGYAGPLTKKSRTEVSFI